MMRLLETLSSEHRLIEQVAGALVTFAERAAEVDAAGEVLGAFCDFFEGYADALHHGREDDILLPRLLAAQLPERGPIAVLRAEHAENRAAVAALRALAGARDLDRDALARLATTARAYCARLWEHIDKEDSVLFPEAESRLVLARAELDAALDAFDDAHAARAGHAGDAGHAGHAGATLGAALVARFPPRTELPEIIRGEGCPACRHFGGACQGVEREWWSELEWDEFRARDL